MPGYDLEILKERLFAHRQITESGCWEWTGSRKKHKFDYGWIGIGSMKDGNARCMHVHRVSAAIWLGLDLGDQNTHTCHKCDNPPCFNPDHLFLGTNADNVADRHAKGRTNTSRGETVNTAKLTEADVRRIRALRFSTNKRDKDIGALFGITQAMASRIIAGRAWKHIPMSAVLDREGMRLSQLLECA